MKWIWITLALLYVLSRIDLIPDTLVGWGWIDDLFVLYLLYRYLKRIAAARRPYDTSGDHQQQYEQPSGRQAQTDQTSPKDAYEILGVSRTASAEEIHAAYRKLANQYHPDKVAHLGQEFQELAEQRFKQIQMAYQELTKK
jgi:uncharacterized membrane protein YkvA (DUF1232 family)